MKKDFILNYFTKYIDIFNNTINRGMQKEYISDLRRWNKKLDKYDPFTTTAPLKTLMSVYLQKSVNLLVIDYLQTSDLEKFKKFIVYLNDNVNELIRQNLL